MNKIVKIVGTIPFIAWVVIGPAACVCQLLIKGFTLGREGTFFQIVNLLEVAVVAVLIFVACKYPSKHTLLGGLSCLAISLCFLGGYGFLEFVLERIPGTAGWLKYFPALVVMWGVTSFSLFVVPNAPPPPKLRNC